MKEIEKLFNPDTSKEEMIDMIKENPSLTILTIFLKMFDYNIEHDDNIQTNN